MCTNVNMYEYDIISYTYFVYIMVLYCWVKGCVECIQEADNLMVQIIAIWM